MTIIEIQGLGRRFGGLVAVELSGLVFAFSGGNPLWSIGVDGVVPLILLLREEIGYHCGSFQRTSEGGRIRWPRISTSSWRMR